MIFKLCFILFFSVSFAQAQDAPIRLITADLKQVKGVKSTVFKECIGAGRANEGLRADWQRQLKEAKQKCGFKYIRFHGLLHDDMGVCTKNSEDELIYNFQYIDELYDYLLSINVKPFVELGFMPTDLKSNDKTVFWWKGNISPPSSYEKYEDLILKLTEHLNERYGTEEVKSWYFEVWNEPNHPGFFSGNQQDYFKMYQHAAKAIKSVNPDFRVGGPATAGCGWISEFIEYCNTSKTAVDFVSTHTYGVRGDLDEFGKKQLFMDKNKNSVSEAVVKVAGKLKSSSLPNLELHFTEWSSSYSSRDPIHDTYQNAPYILNALKKTEQVANSMSYWTFTDIFEESGTPSTAFHGGFGLMNVHGIKKPTFHAYSFANQLGNIELKNEDSSSWVCKNEKGDIQVLAWDFTLLNQDQLPNKVFYRTDLPSKEKGKLKISIKNIPNGKYSVELSGVGYKKADVFSSYLKMGLPTNLTKNQVEILTKVSNELVISSLEIRIKNETFETEMPIRENDIYLIKLTKRVK